MGLASGEVKLLEGEGESGGVDGERGVGVGGGIGVGLGVEEWGCEWRERCYLGPEE